MPSISPTGRRPRRPAASAARPPRLRQGASESGRRRLQAGFSLLEVLVAFSVLAVTLAVIFQVVGGALRSAALAEEYGQAAVIAESMLARVGTELPADGGGTGKEGIYQWRIDSHPTDGGTDALPLFEVAVTVLWGDRDSSRAFTLSTLRVGTAR